MSFEKEEDFFTPMNNGAYGKTINDKNISNTEISFCNEKEAKRLFQELPFDSFLIEKPSIKRV